MSVRRCNHCQLIDGTGFELNVGSVVSCASCGCLWDLTGYHTLSGSVSGQDCVYPQPQRWSNDPLVLLQQSEKKRK